MRLLAIESSIVEYGNSHLVAAQGIGVCLPYAHLNTSQYAAKGVDF